MPLIRCTKKLLAEIGTPVVSSAHEPHTALLGDWYANLLRIGRHNCVIFSSERTLFTFVVVSLKVDVIRDYATLFQRGLRHLLENEGFAPEDVDRVLDDYQELNLAPTNDRSVVGSLNDLARLAEAYIQQHGGCSRCDPGATNHVLNVTPMSRLGMQSPLAATRRVLDCVEIAGYSSHERSTRRKKRPGRLELDAARIERKGDAAIITPHDPEMSATTFPLGAQLASMSDEEVLALYNATIDAMERAAAEYSYVALEVPPGRPQVRYFREGHQWVPRGGVVRCVVEDDEDGQIVIHVDDRALTLEDFGRLLLTYCGWGMRIEFTPDDETEKRPRLEVRDPEE